jgi:4-carboxymuconolactone decarboxylase
MAEHRGLDEDTIATIAAGQRPSSLSDAESVAYDAASALLRGSVLPEPVYKRAVKHFGQEGTAELFYFVGLYSMISITLNGFDVPAPETVD